MMPFVKEMRRNEKELILLGVLKNRTDKENERIEELFHRSLDWAWISGQLLRHRLDGYFNNYILQRQKFYMIKQLDQAIQILASAYCEINKVNLSFAQELFELLGENGIVCAGLKGLVYNTSLYNLSVRRSNDIDILVSESDLRTFDELMRRKGFIQSQDGGYSEATKRAKLIQIMNYHDLVPYCKLIDSSFMRLIRVDVNFQFDSKEHEITKEVLDCGIREYCMNGYAIRGLVPSTHLCHLAVHFYREASNSLWTEKLKDVDLYKLVDIENTIRSYSQEQMQEWIDMVRNLNLERHAYFMLFYLNSFYPNVMYERFMQQIEPCNTFFLDRVKIEGTTNSIQRNEMFADRAFNMKYSIVEDDNGNVVKDFSHDIVL